MVTAVDPPEHPGSLSRRLLLGGAVAVAAAGAVGSAALSRRPATVSSLRSQHPFYVAHRGGGRDWPEMTAYAYQQATRIRALQAIEISVCRSADGVLVCSHDATTGRLTGRDLVIAEQSWETLSRLEVSAAETRDPGQPSRPFSRLDEVLEAHAADVVMFVEPKVAAAGDPLMERMLALGQPERVVWKQPINSTRFGTARQHGFTTWGYVLDEPAHLGENLTRYAASADIDMVGAPRAEDDSFVAAVVEAARTNGKPAVMWEIRSPEDRARALRLGCTGLMASDVAGLLDPHGRFRR